MKEEKNQTTSCTPCERNFERKVHQIVREGTPETEQTRHKRRTDARKAFTEQKTEGKA